MFATNSNSDTYSVGIAGFEPTRQEPKSCVLPLYYTPVIWKQGAMPAFQNRFANLHHASLAVVVLDSLVLVMRRRNPPCGVYSSPSHSTSLTPIFNRNNGSPEPGKYTVRYPSREFTFTFSFTSVSRVIPLVCKGLQLP